LPNLSSTIDFLNIYPNIDLQYEVNPQDIKENIILKEKVDNPLFIFNLNTKGLIPKLLEDNSIAFYDTNDPEKTIFSMDAPYMYDAKNELNNDIKLTLEPVGKGYNLKVQPNHEWLSSADRVFPIIIDPTLQTKQETSNITDNHVSEGLPNSNFENSHMLKTGNSTGGVHRSYIKFNLPTLTTSDMVINANLYMYLLTANSAFRQVNVHKVQGDWSGNSITWNNKPAYDTKVVDYQFVKDLEPYYTWDVTSIVKDWYTTGNNYGLMLKNHDEVNIGYTEYVSANTSSAYTQYRASVVLSYINNSGLESYWTYHSQDVGRAGTGYVNDYNGNVIFTHNDLAMNGNRMPVSINHVYNSNDQATDIKYGSGWRLNLNQRIAEQSIDGVQYYIYTDGDGTKHYFKYDASRNAIVDELSPTDYTLIKNANGTYNIKDKKNNQLNFTAIGSEGVGYLLTMIDSNGNTLSLGYNGVILNRIIDGAGRETTLDLTPQGYLIGITDPSNRRTSFSYTGVQLTTITYPDGTTTEYTYDVSDKLTSAAYNNGYKITYEYYTVAPYRAKKILETHGDGTLGNELNISYGNNTTFFTDVKGRKNTYQFNFLGNTINVKDADGNAEYYKYLSGANANKLSLESKLQKTVINMLKNHNIEQSSSWTANDWTGSTGSGSFTTEEKYFGNQSLKVTKTNTLARQFYEQLLTLEKGKTYTLSGYTKTNTVSSTNHKGAALFINYQDSTGAWQTKDSTYVNGTTGFNRQEVTFTLPADAASTSVYARAGIIEETGTAYFDALQLEEGTIANRYNLVENSSFEFNTGDPLFWTKNGSTDANDTSVNVEKAFGTRSVRLNGVADKTKAFYQNINVSGQANDVFVVSGWGKGSSVSLTNGSGRYFALDVGIHKTDGTYQWEVVTFNEDSADWQYASDKVIASGPYTDIVYYVLYYNQANTAYFDGLQLYKEEFGQSYTYDTNGNVVSSADLAKQQSRFEYTNNDLTKAVDPKGSQFKYTYGTDGKHNLETATSAENVVYSFTYDSYGNPKTSKVGDTSLFIDSTATYTTDGNYLKTLKDSQGNTVTYNNDSSKGTLDSVTDAKSKTTSYTYDPNTDQLKAASKTADGQTVSNSYTYENDRIKTVTSNNNQVTYSFDYDSMGNNAAVKVGNQPLITNTYEQYNSNRNTGNLLESTYGNNQKVGSDYDILDRVTALKYGGEIKFKYAYDGNGNLGIKEDLVNGVNYKYTYDFANRLGKVTDNQGNSTNYNYDANNNLIKLTERFSYMTAAQDTSNLTGRYNVPDSTLVSLNKPATASSVEAGTVTADKTVDGNTATRWASQYSDPQWIYVDLGTTTNIKRVVLNWEAAYARAYSIQVSNDAVNWTTVYSTSSGDGGIDDLNNLSASGRYVRMYGTQRATSYGYSLWEFSVYKSNFVASSQEASSVSADKAFDNNPQTRWSSQYSDPQWIYADLGSTKTIKRISLDWEAAYGKSYDIQTSNDAVNWTTIYSTTSGDGGTDDITGLNASARYVRMYGKLRGTSYGYSLWEFNIYGSDSIITQYEYDRDNRPVKTILNNLKSVSNKYDALGRVEKTTVDTSTPYITSYNYLAGISTGSTTAKVSSMINAGNSTSYTYDPNGNIETITQGSNVIKYYYNELNELTREDNQVLNKTIVYSYDVGGNFSNKVEYPYTTGTPGTPTKTYSYAYDDANWKDKLTSYDGKAITYDAIGNPLTYDGWTYTWEAGRQLATMSKTGQNLSFKYNDSGIRTQKTVNGVTTKYYLNGDKVTLEDNGTDKIYYSYGATGNLVSMNLNGTEYYYIRNAQGDIIGLFDSTGTKVVGYTYDSWGKLISTTGTLASTVGAKNPYLYRGYRSDKETGLYYLQSRYYSPEWGRFINADGMVGNFGELLSTNMFAYCLNNPVNQIDPNGKNPFALLIGAVAATVAFEVVAVVAVVAVAVVLTAVLIDEISDRFTADSDEDIGQSSPAVPGAPGTYAPDRALPRTKHGDSIPDSDSPHTQLGRRTDDGHTYNQGREWVLRPDGRGITADHDWDFTDHGDPENHTNPHKHKLEPNNPQKAPKGGYRRGNPIPWDPNA